MPKAGALWAVVLAGGSGTRFWPESRARNAKQFLPIFGSKTLLEQTVDRLSPLVPRSRVLVITHERDTARVSKLLRIPRTQVIGEPVGRNTAPCAALAADWVARRDPDGVIALLPADHLIVKTALFRRALAAASAVASRSGLPVTFGIKPAFAHTGYGYLETGTVYARERGFAIRKLKRFREKPALAQAKAFVRAGRFLWNSGMFVWRAADLLKETRRHLPAAARLIDRMHAGNWNKNFKRLYPAMPGISIDYGLMEKMRGRILTLPVDIGWYDLGSWLAMPDLWPRDAQNNSVLGEPLLVESRGNIVRSGRRMVALLGVENLVVVDTEDALLVCAKDQTESVRKIVNRLADKKGWRKYL